jgi:methionyl-tRNA formyltransferase
MDKYVFVGNRKYILDEMIKSGLNICKILVMKNSYLHNVIKNSELKYEVVESKKHLLKTLENLEYDVLISNGCKYILPISKMKKALYINIHPSYLPDLKGMDPVNGALLFGRNAGATCHYMNDEIDSGDIISQVLIPNTNDLDAALLYQLCFQAEVEAFRLALQQNFTILMSQNVRTGVVYYTQNFDDRIINFEEDVSTLLRRVKAFGYQSKGCFFSCKGKTYKFFDATLLNNPFLVEYSKKFINNEIIFAYEDCIVFKKDEKLLKFSKVACDVVDIKPHDFIEKSSATPETIY